VWDVDGEELQAGIFNGALKSSCGVAAAAVVCKVRGSRHVQIAADVERHCVAEFSCNDASQGQGRKYQCQQMRHGQRAGNGSSHIVAFLSKHTRKLQNLHLSRPLLPPPPRRDDEHQDEAEIYIY
jgi:hypothetical protein